MFMKHHMNDHVDRVRHTMFKDATRTVQDHLNKMCKVLKEQMENKADEIYVSMRHDYLKALGGEHVNTTVLSKEERTMRAQIKPVLMNVDRRFKAVLDGTVDDALDDGDDAQPKAEEDGEQPAAVKAEEPDDMDIDSVAPGTANEDTGFNEADLQDSPQGRTSLVDEKRKIRKLRELLGFRDEHHHGVQTSTGSNELEQDDSIIDDVSGRSATASGEDAMSADEDSAGSEEGTGSEEASSEDGSHRYSDEEEFEDN